MGNNIFKNLYDLGYEVGIIVRDEEKLPKDKSSNQKVILPMTHNPDNVEEDHLAFSSMMHSPTQFSQQSFQGALDPGTLVYVKKIPGQNRVDIIGQANDLVNYDRGQASGSGGKDLLGHQFFQDLFDREINVLIPPDIQETTDNDGVKVKKIKEKNKKHKHSRLKGLPSHNAVQTTTGYKLEQVKNIPTAKQTFNAIPTEDMLSNLPGDPMSMSQMFQGLMGNSGGGAAGAGGSGAGNATAGQGNFSVGFAETPMDRIKANVDPQVYDAITSMSELVQGSESEVFSYATPGRVHTETFLNNAEQLLCQCTSLADVYDVMNRLQHDETLFGLDKIANNIMEMETPWGNANVIITATGDIEYEYANANVSIAFANNLSSPASSPSAGGGGGSGGGGGNMFGKSSSIMQDMFKRLAPNNEKESKKMTETLNQGDMAQKLWKFAETTLKGGNPLDPSNFS